MVEATVPLGVWLVEDNHLLRENLATLIRQESHFHCPVSVSNCEEALAALDLEPPPDIVLMDIGLPQMSGIEGTARFRSRSPATRIVILTIHEEDEKVFAAICAGASGYLLKPSSPEEILDALRAVARGEAPINGYIARKVLESFSRMGPPQSPGHDYGLTTREREILQLLVEGFTMQQLAGRLDLSYHTVDSHIRNIYGKLHVHSRSKAVAKALQEGLV